MGKASRKKRERRLTGKSETVAGPQAVSTPADIIPAAISQLKVGTAMAEKLVNDMGLKKDIACREGCAACCRQGVIVRAYEVIGIAGFLKSNLDDGKFSEIRERVREAAKAYRAVDDKAKGGANISCPLLENNRCIVYSIRPSYCCSLTSSDVRDCSPDSGSEGIKINPLLKGAMSNFSELSDQELIGGTKAKLGVVEFIPALDAILDDPLEQCKKWFAGEDLFQNARIEEKDLMQPEDLGSIEF